MVAVAPTKKKKKPVRKTAKRVRVAQDIKKPQYNIIDRVTKKVVGTALTLKSARGMVDRRDNAYGGYRYYQEKIQ